MSRKPRITVAGAGALGLTTALALADAGAEVAVYDPSPDGGAASAVAAGMLAPVFEAVLDVKALAHFDLMLAARDLWPALETRIGITVDRAGAMAVGDAAFLHATDADVRKLGLHPTELSRNAMIGLAPGLAPGWGHALLTREDWRIDAAAALVALRRAAQAAGVSFHPRAADGFEGGERLVIATGMGRDLGVIAPSLARLSPIKGHILRTA
ncbi:MAG: FAD-dependent oxidoreductase, partial [Phenylobacterium sp.]|uniref:FAD-dependent oxidoreductase n=1 Tax=Phenylobacterium sp. TaxID=1871053 RepID=UPI00272F1CEA